MGKLTVSLPLSLLAVPDILARQWNTTRSGAVAELLRQTGQQELAEGYVAWAEKNKRDSEREFFKDLKFHEFPVEKGNNPSMFCCIQPPGGEKGLCGMKGSVVISVNCSFRGPNLL